MALFTVSLHQISIMGLMILIGFYCYKKKFVNKDQTQALSRVLLNVINPMVLFQSFQTSLTPELLKSIAGSFILNAVGLFLLIFIRPLLIKKKNNPYVAEESIAFIYSNSGFVAIPLANALWGSTGVIYVTPYLTVSNLFFWTHAYTTMSGQKIDRHNIVKSLTTPILLGIYAGIFCTLTRIQPPALINETISSLASMNTPLAMMIAGMTIAQTDIVAAFKKLRSYYIVFLKLIVAPVLTILMCLPFAFMGFDPLMLTVLCLTVACPAAASYVMLAITFEKNAIYCSELFAISTLFSGLTLPLTVFMTRIFDIVAL